MIKSEYNALNVNQIIWVAGVKTKIQGLLNNSEENDDYNKICFVDSFPQKSLYSPDVEIDDYCFYYWTNICHLCFIKEPPKITYFECKTLEAYYDETTGAIFYRNDAYKTSQINKTIFRIPEEDKKIKFKRDR